MHYLCIIYMHILFFSLFLLNLCLLKFPCNVCSLDVKDKDHSIRCDLWDKWSHINCVNINKLKLGPLP